MGDGKNRNNIAARQIRAACEKAGISVDQLGKQLGITTIYRRLETGKFNKQEFEKIAEILGCSYESYFITKDGSVIK